MNKIQWYPGHMKKALREINENIKLIDIVLEILDARIPKASKNPDIDNLAKDKSRVIILNKEDMANPKETEKWESYFKDNGYFCLSIDARNKGSMKRVTSLINEAGKKKRERDKKRGILKRPVRVLVCGIPNCGKSTFINTYVGKKSAKTGNKPGVTKGKQWIRMASDVELLDTPGILWPKFDDKKTGEYLAMCGSIKDEILKRQELCLTLISYLKDISPGLLCDFYKVDDADPERMLLDICKSRNYLISGGNPDVKRGANQILDDFKSGRIGRVTLECL